MYCWTHRIRRVLFNSLLPMHLPPDSSHTDWWEWRPSLLHGMLWLCMLLYYDVRVSNISISSRRICEQYILYVYTQFWSILHLDTYILWYYAAMPWRRRGTSSNTIASGMDCTHSSHYAPARNVVLSMSVPSMQRMERWPKLLQLFRWEIVSNKGICCQIDRSFGLVVWDVRVLWSVIQGRFLSRVVSQENWESEEEEGRIVFGR